MYRTRNLRIEIRVREKGHLGRPHCHVIGPGAEAVVDLVTGEVIESFAFRNKALKEIERELRPRLEQLMEVWNEYHEEEKH